MKLRPGEAVALVIRRGEDEPFNHFVAVRKSESSFDFGSNDFRLDCGQETLFEIPQGAELRLRSRKQFPNSKKSNSKIERAKPRIAGQDGGCRKEEGTK
jgi:hypothetical protein